MVDLGLPDSQGLEAVRRARAAAPHVALVVLTGQDDESLAARTLQEGAQDYLLKGEIETRGLWRALHYATERNQLEEAAFFAMERTQATLDCIGDAVVSTDPSGRITFFNFLAEVMTGFTSQEAIGRPMAEVLRIVDQANGRAITNPSKLPPSGFLMRRDGLEVAIEASMSPIQDRGGRPAGIVAVLRDVTISRALAVEVVHAAQHDALTGLPNRTLLGDRIGQAIVLAQRYKKQIAVLFLDVDRFKHINDSLGHAVGDRLLQSVSKRLGACVRATDTVSRQGGDEFVVLLSFVERAEDAGIAATKMLEAVAEVHTIDGNDLHVTASIGVSVYPDDGLDAETLIKNADTAMYQAKENGRHAYRFFKAAMNMQAVAAQAIEEGLRGALERKEFALHYQPKIDLKTGEIVGAEALLRWTHSARGSIAPAQFIPVAEESGLIHSIGRWVLREACRQGRAWVDAGLPTATVAVNVSALEFGDPEFAQGVFSALDESGLEPALLELELTESVLMTHVENTAAMLQSFRDKGVRISVDDFGTGYSSLSYLQKFPIDSLKIDQSFVGQIGIAEDDSTIVAAVINLARSLRLRVVAEGVETMDQVAFLQAHQCDEAQGFYFSHPVPAEQYATLLANGVSESVRPLRQVPAGSALILSARRPQEMDRVAAAW